MQMSVPDRCHVCDEPFTEGQCIRFSAGAKVTTTGADIGPYRIKKPKPGMMRLQIVPGAKRLAWHLSCQP